MSCGRKHQHTDSSDGQHECMDVFHDDDSRAPQNPFTPLSFDFLDANQFQIDSIYSSLRNGLQRIFHKYVLPSAESCKTSPAIPSGSKLWRFRYRFLRERSRGERSARIGKSAEGLSARPQYHKATGHCGLGRARPPCCAVVAMIDAVSLVGGRLWKASRYLVRTTICSLGNKPESKPPMGGRLYWLMTIKKLCFFFIRDFIRNNYSRMSTVLVFHT